MRLLMVQLPTSHLGAGERVYPLGLSRLSALVPADIPQFCLDLNLAEDPWQALKSAICEFQPDVTALSFRNLDPLAGHEASYLPSLVTAARMVRFLVPQCRLLAGGPAFSLFARELMVAVPEIDFGLSGEGEAVFVDLLAPVVKPAEIPGLAWRTNGRLHLNPPRAKQKMKNLPPLDPQGFNPADYLYRNCYVAVMGIEGKRGCDLSCAYCVYPQLGGNRLRLRPPAQIVSEIETLHKDTGANLFHFTDGVVNRPNDHFEAVCRLLRERRLAVQWTGFFRENHLTRARLELAQGAGLAAIYLSGDALTETGLQLLKKRLSIDTLLQAAQICADSGILTVCHFLVNLPGETAALRQAGRDTLERILEIHAGAANLGAVIFNHVRLYPGAPLTRRLLKTGALRPDTNMLYPTYFNPSRGSHYKYELELMCHSAGTFARLNLKSRRKENASCA